MRQRVILLLSLACALALPKGVSAAAVAGGYSHTVVIRTSDGTVWSWGANSNGQLGDRSNTQRKTPVQTSTLTGIVAVAAGANHTLALKADGTVRAWGDDQYGQIGDGTSGEDANRNAPAQVRGLSGNKGCRS